LAGGEGMNLFLLPLLPAVVATFCCLLYLLNPKHITNLPFLPLFLLQSTKRLRLVLSSLNVPFRSCRRKSTGSKVCPSKIL